MRLLNVLAGIVLVAVGLYLLMNPIMWFLWPSIVLVAVGLYLLKNRNKPTNYQSDDQSNNQSDNPTNYGIFFARERWMQEQADLLKKEREDKQAELLEGEGIEKQDQNS